MSLIEQLALAVFGGIFGGMLALLPTWVKLAREIKAHGFDNHPCGRKECCPW